MRGTSSMGEDVIYEGNVIYGLPSSISSMGDRVIYERKRAGAARAHFANRRMSTSSMAAPDRTDRVDRNLRESHSRDRFRACLPAVDTSLPQALGIKLIG